MNRTDIEYLDYTWNPLAMRCTPVSEGCEHCWHIRMAKRMAGNPRFPDEVRAAYAGDHEPILIKDRLDEPLRLRKPSRIGVQFMGDLFHEDVLPEHILQVWRVMYEARDHTFLILTKRPDRMERILNEWMPSTWQLAYLEPFPGPLPNVWLGVTAENQQRAAERIPLLLQCPAAVRFVSVEPMLGPVNVSGFLPLLPETQGQEAGWAIRDHWFNTHTFLDFVIVGAETGPGARTMQLSDAYNVKRQCKEAGVPFFFKSAGKNIAIPDDLLVREWPGGRQ